MKIYFSPSAKQVHDPRKKENFQQQWWQQQQKDYVGNYTGIISKTNKKYINQICSELYIIVLNMVVFGETAYILKTGRKGNSASKEAMTCL